MKLREKLARLGGVQSGQAKADESEERVLETEYVYEHEEPLAYDEETGEVCSLPRRPRRDATPARPPADTLLQGDRLASLRDQMARIAVKLERPAKPALSSFARQALSAELAREEPSFSASSSSASLPGDTHATADGPLRVVRVDCEADHAHGVVPVASALAASASDVAVLALDSSLAEIDFSRALYIDTETTGLAGGAGTLPFLIGMAWFEGERLCVEQLLLERPGLEVPMLRRLAERMANASAVVSFNGKSFDWPLLRTRFVLSRVAVPALPPHLDLLHCARRVYKRRLGSVRLVHLEEELLGFARVDDVSGEMIPLLYLGFLRGQVHGSALAPVVEHNRSDLIALAALLGELARRFRGEAPAQDARDQLGFAGVAARAAAAERALDFAAGAIEADVRGELSCEAHFLAGELRLKALDVAGAERAFTLSVEAACGDEAKAGRAHLALAKLYEHRLKRYADALVHARCAAAWEGDEASARRVARLSLKCDRMAEPLLPRAFS